MDGYDAANSGIMPESQIVQEYIEEVVRELLGHVEELTTAAELADELMYEGPRNLYRIAVRRLKQAIDALNDIPEWHERHGY